MLTNDDKREIAAMIASALDAFAAPTVPAVKTNKRIPAKPQVKGAKSNKRSFKVEDGSVRTLAKSTLKAELAYRAKSPAERGARKGVLTSWVLLKLDKFDIAQLLAGGVVEVTLKDGRTVEVVAR